MLRALSVATIRSSGLRSPGVTSNCCPAWSTMNKSRRNVVELFLSEVSDIKDMANAEQRNRKRLAEHGSRCCLLDHQGINAKHEFRVRSPMPDGDEPKQLAHENRNRDERQIRPTIHHPVPADDHRRHTASERSNTSRDGLGS